MGGMGVGDERQKHKPLTEKFTITCGIHQQLGQFCSMSISGGTCVSLQIRVKVNILDLVG